MPTLRRFVGLLPAGSSARVALRSADRRLHVERQDHRIPPLWELRLCLALVPGKSRAQPDGVNARLMAPAKISGARVRHLDGANTEQYID
jgi:hypothetical protein